MNTEIIPLSENEASALALFAKPIWYEHYSPIIGKKQVEYMLDKFQNEEAITSQIQEGYQYFLVKHETRLMGYFSLQLQEKASLFISKFYLSKTARGKGLGKQMLSYIQQFAIDKNCKTIDLTVNKNNPAYQIYLKLGFTNQGSIKFDIGEGYIMDDYLMSKAVPNQ